MADCSYEIALEIQKAIEKADLGTIKRLAERCPFVLLHDTSHQWPVIHECLSRGCVDLELVKLFLQAGGDVNRRTESGVSLAYLASKLYEENDIVTLLKQNGAKMSVYEEAIAIMDSTTFETTQPQCAKFQQLLSDNPALVHKVGHRGLTLLHHAVQYRYAFVPLLLQCGANPNTVTFVGQTPLGMCPPVNTAEDQSCRETLLRFGAKLSDCEKAAELIQAGKSAEVISLWEKCPQLVNKFLLPGSHCLHLAAQFSTDLKMIEYLLSHSVDPNVPDAEFETPLHRVSHRSCTSTHDPTEEVIRALIKAGADINKPNKEGNTPLHLFARRPWIARVMFLVDLGAELNVRNEANQTPLDVVYQRKFPKYRQLASWLKSRGALRGLDFQSVDIRRIK